MVEAITTPGSAARTVRVAILVGLMSTAGCLPSLLDNPPRDARSMLPDRFESSGDTRSATNGNQTPDSSPGVGSQEWRSYFASVPLQNLIDEALRNNQELNLQMQELIIGRAEVDARFGELFPKIGAGVGAGVEKVGAETSQGAADRLTGVPEPLPDFRFGLRGSWEVDIWGRLRDSTSAADARYRASIEGRRFIVTQLVGEIARSYYELVALDGEFAVLERNIAIQKNALAVVKLQKDAARVTELAVQRFEAEVLKNRARLFSLQQQRGVTENRINFLVGRRPQPIARDGAFAAPLPSILEAGVPTDLLKNRPDIRAAELRLDAAKLDVNVARADFLPALSIDAEVGFRAFNPLHLVTVPEALVANLAGNLMAPVLNRPVIEARYRTANAQQIQAVIMYERTVLQAYTDVVNALVVFHNLRQGYDLSSEQVATLERAVTTSNVLFQSARADYMEVLLTRRDALDAELELIETRKNLWLSTVDLYQALGGGWQETASTTSLPSTTAATTATAPPAPVAAPAAAPGSSDGSSPEGAVTSPPTRMESSTAPAAPTTNPPGNNDG